MIEDNWKHLKDKEIEEIKESRASEKTLLWAKYHLSERGHACQICKEKIENKKKPE